MELISVIVPIYKVEEYLKQCVDSIINQTYRNLEIILVDDGSPDNCGNMCDEYAIKDNRIKVIHKKNGGLSSARNAGLDIAKGEYFCFIDSDDLVSEKFIEKLYNLCKVNNVDIAECDFIRFENEILKSEEFNINVEQLSSLEMQKRIYSSHVQAVVVWNKLYRRYIYENLRFPEGKINEDEFTTYKAFYNCRNNIVVSNEKLYFYRYNSQSIMGRKFNVKRLDALEALKLRMQFYNEHNEKELYDLSVKEYQNLLKWFYRLTKENIEDSKKYLMDIKLELKKNKKEYMKLKNINIKEKIKMELFVMFPNLYISLIDKKERRKSIADEI